MPLSEGDARFHPRGCGGFCMKETWGSNNTGADPPLKSLEISILLSVKLKCYMMCVQVSLN